jgi:hypothetical protein
MLEKDDDKMFYYKHKTKSGNSGGPILLKTKNSKYQVIGIHKGLKHNHGRCNTFKVINHLNHGFESEFRNFKL